MPHTTLRDRLSGKVHPDTRTTGRAPSLTLLEEAKLVDHIKTMANYSYGCTRQECVNLAHALAVQLGKRGKEQLSLKWMRGFLAKWPDLSVLKPRNLEYSRAKMASMDTVSSYFKNLECCPTEHSLTDKPNLIFNIDERAYSSTEHTPPCIVGSSSYCPTAVTSGSGKTVTVLECISASGAAIPPFFIFPGKRMNAELMKGKSPGADGNVSETGWSKQAIFRHYLMSHFVKYIHGHDNQKVLLILDCHKSPVSVGLCEWARDNGIIFFYLPPHTSHILQPLDVSCYRPFEWIFNNECHIVMRQTEATLTRYNVYEVACRL